MKQMRQIMIGAFLLVGLLLVLSSLSGCGTMTYQRTELYGGKQTREDCTMPNWNRVNYSPLLSLIDRQHTYSDPFGVRICKFVTE